MDGIYGSQRRQGGGGGELDTQEEILTFFLPRISCHIIQLTKRHNRAKVTLLKAALPNSLSNKRSNFF